MYKIIGRNLLSLHPGLEYLEFQVHLWSPDQIDWKPQIKMTQF